MQFNARLNLKAPAMLKPRVLVGLVVSELQVVMELR